MIHSHWCANTPSGPFNSIMTRKNDLARILAVGNATLDIINIVDGYPAEDMEVRATAQQIRRGGNAANTLVALSQLGHQCSWAGTLANEPDGSLILADLTRYRIDTCAVHTIAHGKVPT